MKYEYMKESEQCACDRKAYEEEQKYFKDKEHRELVSRNTSICFDESRMEEWTFKNADMSDAVMHKGKNYVDNWDEMKRNHIGCLFWGPVGTGKSYISTGRQNGIYQCIGFLPAFDY